MTQKIDVYLDKGQTIHIVKGERVGGEPTIVTRFVRVIKVAGSPHKLV